MEFEDQEEDDIIEELKPECWVCGEFIEEFHDFFELNAYSIGNSKVKIIIAEIREELPIVLHTHCVYNFIQGKLIEIQNNAKPKGKDATDNGDVGEDN